MRPEKTYPVSKPVGRLLKSGILDTGDVSAAVAIENAVVSILTHDVRSSLQDVPGRDVGFMRFYELRQFYYDWMDAMVAAGVPSGPTLDVILEGKPLSAVDKAWCRRKGWARGQVKAALQLYQLVASRHSATETRLTA